MDFLTSPTRRRVLFSALYLSEGAPIGFIWLALPTWLRLAHLPIEQITWLTAILVIPWTFKFAWAPLVDLLQSRWWTLKHWIIASQLVMGLTLLPLIAIDLQKDFGLIVPLLLLHALAASTQDVAIDALCISVTDASERGRLNGWMQAGMLLGRAMFGGGALLLGSRLGFPAVIGLLVTVTTGSSLLLAFSKPRVESTPETLRGRYADVWANLVVATQRSSTWLGLLFALIGGAAFKSLEVVIGPLLVDRGYSEQEIGVFSAGPMILLMIVGSLIGGHLADRRACPSSVAAALLAFVVPIGLLAIFDHGYGSVRGAHLLVLLAAAAFGIGLFTAASYALFMDLTRPGIAATQFSAFMGATNGCESWSSYAIGRIIPVAGYPAGLLSMCAVSLLALPVLFALSRSRASRDEAAV